MTPTDWITIILLGAIMGMVGQGIRILPGLKKLRDRVTVENQRWSDEFRTSTLVYSLFMGSVAGIIAIFALSDEEGKIAINKELLTGLMAAGYAGTDFVEGFSKKYLPKAVNPGTQPAA